ncbi:MAG: hypothetical protein M3680_15495 [Myxococcota bacterium]|nr:hypothetical protein [Myxococcota bacterium]
MTAPVASGDAAELVGVTPRGCDGCWELLEQAATQARAKATRWGERLMRTVFSDRLTMHNPKSGLSRSALDHPSGRR